MRLRGGADEDMGDVSDGGGGGGDSGMQDVSNPLNVGRGRPVQRGGKRVRQKPRPRPKSRAPARRSQARKRPSGKITRTQLKRPNFSIKRSGRTFTLIARDVNDAVLHAVKAFLRNRKGVVYVDGRKMTRAGALKYISVQLQKQGVTVAFRKR